MPIYVIAKDGVYFQRIECENRRYFCVNINKSLGPFWGAM